MVLVFAPSFVVALTLFAGHAQTVFISLFGLGLYALWRGLNAAVKQAQLKIDLQQGYLALASALLRFFFSYRLTLSLLTYLWPLLFASILAVALAAVQLIPTAELSALSIRSGGLTFREVVSFSVRPGTLHYTLLPPLGVDLSQVWGEAFGEWVAYLGMSGLALTLLGGLSAIWNGKARRFLFVAGGGLILSLGLYSGPLYVALYYLMPGFSLFRAPARWLLLYLFGAAILAGFGFDGLLNSAALVRSLREALSWFQKKGWGFSLLFGGLLLLPLLLLIGRRPPPPITLVTWFIILVLTMGLGYSRLHTAHSQAHISVHTWSPILLILLLLAELFWAAQTLNYNQPTAPQAYHSMRNATAFLLAVDPPPTAGQIAEGQTHPPDRFLSLSGISYDPGDAPGLGENL